MKVVKRQIVSNEYDVIVDVLCNMCGKTCSGRSQKVMEDGDDNMLADLDERFHGLIEANVSIGHFSPTLPDLMTYSFSLCERCLKRLFESFAIQPEEKECC